MVLFLIINMAAVTSCANNQYLFAKRNREKSFLLNLKVKLVNPVIVPYWLVLISSYGIFLISTAVNKCSPNPCKNMGGCSEFEDDYVCNCPQGFKGKTCEGTFIFENFRQNESCDDRYWWNNIIEIRETIALLFSSSLTTLVFRWRQRNLPKRVRHAWVFGLFFQLVVSHFRRCRSWSNSPVPFSHKTILYVQRFRWKAEDKMEHVPRKRRL